VAVVLAAAELPAPLSADAELAFYRILQEALKNVEQHARARHVTVSLTSTDVRVQLAIRDDGIGFDHAHHLARRQADSGLGLLGLRERASYVGATLAIKSVRGAGTAIEVRLPLPAPIVAAA
jgi:signal transduction histidine kinase